MADTVVVDGKAFDFEIKDGNIEIVLDSDKDGQPSVKIVVSMVETVEEAIAAIKKVI